MRGCRARSARKSLKRMTEKHWCDKQRVRMYAEVEGPCRLKMLHALPQETDRLANLLRKTHVRTDAGNLSALLPKDHAA